MIIGISGKAQHGKDTFGNFLAQELFKQTGHPYVLMAYANELKNMVQRHFDLSHEQLWGDEKEVEDKRYKKPFSFYGRMDRDELPNVYWTGREIMQSFGDFYRSIDGAFWTKNLFRIIDEKEYVNVIITDCRYPNELEPVFERGGHHIRVYRDIDLDTHGKDHSSETSLDGDFKIDFKVQNHWTLKELRVAASEVADLLLNMKMTKEEKTYG